MPGSLPERATKQLLVVSTAAAIALHLFVDPAAGPLLQALTAASFVAAFACARVWRAPAVGVVAALAPVAPVVLAAIVRVDALNLFSTVSLAALFGAMLPNLAPDRWTLPRSWRAPLAIWGLTLALAWPVMIVREAGLRLGALRDTGALDSWALLSTPQVESWILYTAITQLVALLWLDLMCAEGQDADARLHPGVHGLWIGATAASVAAVYQGLVDISFLSGGPWPGLQRAAGTLLDANAYGAIAALAGPVAFVSIPVTRIRHARITQGAVLAINWAGAWMSGSRTGLLCGAFGTVALVYQLARANRSNPTAGRESTSLLAGVVAIVLVLILAAGAVGPVRRVLEARGVESGRELWSRGGYGTVAMQMIRDYPLTGVGIGSFNWMAPDYWRVMAHDKLPFDNAQNWWRHQVAELGIIASLPVLMWSAMLAWMVISRRSRPGGRIETETHRGLLIGVGVASLVGMPTQNPLVLLLFFAIAARFDALTRAEPQAAPREQRLAAIALIAGLLIAAGYAAAHLALARGSLKPAVRAERTQRDYVVGTYLAERSSEGAFRWTKKHASYALNVPTQHLSIRFHVQHPDVGVHPVKIRIYTPCETLVDEFRTDTSEDGRSVELPPGQTRAVFDVDVSRTWRPSDTGGTDRRDLGAAVEADFVGNDGVVASEEHWIRLKQCD